MVKKAAPSEVAETPLPTEVTPVSETTEETPVETVEAPPEEGEAPPPTQEAEKPDVRSLLTELPDHERKAVLQDVYGEDLGRAEQSGYDRALIRLQNQQSQQAQANQGLQETLKNLDGAVDDNTRAGHVQAYATWQTQQSAQQWSQEALDSVREGLGVPNEEHDEILIRLHQQGARERRVPTLTDYVKHVTGDRFMPKSQVNKGIREEIRAQLAELQGQKIENQEAPVSTGQGEPPSDQAAEDDRILADPKTTGEQKADAFERRFGYRPRNI